MLEHLPADHPTLRFYAKLFREMTGAILAAQQPDGLWRPSMLDPNPVPPRRNQRQRLLCLRSRLGREPRAPRPRPTLARHHARLAGLVTRTKTDGFVG